MKTAFYIFQLVFYVIAMAVYFFLGVLQFMTKPGTRFLFPAFVLALMVWQNQFFIGIYWYFASSISTGSFGVIIMGVMAIATVFIVSWLYVYFSRLLGMVLGVFPTMSRPIMPMREIEAPKGTNMTPVTVRIVVPPLWK